MRIYFILLILFISTTTNAQIVDEDNTDTLSIEPIKKKQKRRQARLENAVSEDIKSNFILANATVNDPSKYVTVNARVLSIDSITSKTQKAKEYNLELIEDGIRKSTKTLFTIAAFFGPGSYEIPEDKILKARAYFTPFIDSIVTYSNKYFEIPRDITIVINGYSDASKFSKNSFLYKEFIRKKKISNPTNQQLNLWISELRAIELSKLFEKILKEKANNFIGLPKIRFENVEVGRGEMLPDPNISNYKEIDNRRRIVIVYWSCIPN